MFSKGRLFSLNNKVNMINNLVLKSNYLKIINYFKKISIGLNF